MGWLGCTVLRGRVAAADAPPSSTHRLQAAHRRQQHIWLPGSSGSPGQPGPHTAPPRPPLSLAEVVVHLLVEVLAQEVAPEAEERVHLLALTRAALSALLHRRAGEGRVGGQHVNGWLSTQSLVQASSLAHGAAAGTTFHAPRTPHHTPHHQAPPASHLDAAGVELFVLDLREAVLLQQRVRGVLELGDGRGAAGTGARAGGGQAGWWNRGVGVGDMLGGGTSGCSLRGAQERGSAALACRAAATLILGPPQSQHAAHLPSSELPMRGEARREPGELPSSPLSLAGEEPSSQPGEGRREGAVAQCGVRACMLVQRVEVDQGQGCVARAAQDSRRPTPCKRSSHTDQLVSPRVAAALTHRHGGRRLAKGPRPRLAVPALGQGGGVEVGGLAAACRQATGKRRARVKGVPVGAGGRERQRQAATASHRPQGSKV